MKNMKLGIRAVLGLVIVCGSLAVTAQGEWGDNFGGTEVNVEVWTDCLDLFDDGASYDWHDVDPPGDWIVSDGSLVKGASYPSKLSAYFDAVVFDPDPDVYVKARVKSLSTYHMEIDVGQAGGKIITAYLKADLDWVGSFPPDGTGYLLMPFFAGGDSGDARPTDDWFDVVVHIDRDGDAISLYVDDDLKVSVSAGGWLDSLTQIDTVSITVTTALDNANPWYVDYIHVTHDAGPATFDCGSPGTIYLGGDISGPEGEPDCRVDMCDFAAFAAVWLGCTDPNPLNCP